MFCRKCGSPIKDGDKFCPVCGTPCMAQKPHFVVRRLPVFLIIVLTIGFIISSLFIEEGETDLVLMLSCLPGIVLMLLIYKMNRIEHEPLGLMMKLFSGRGIACHHCSRLYRVATWCLYRYLFFVG